MKKVAVIYHSGVGNTRKVAEKIHSKLSKPFCAELFSVENIQNTFDLSNYDALVIGFPVIHTHPTRKILKFIDSIERLTEPKPTFIFTTCALYSANTLRIFAKHCVSKNVIPVVHRVFNGCPATDGVLLAPYVKRFSKFQKNIDANIEKVTDNFTQIVENNSVTLNMPRFKAYSIINYPNKLLGQFITVPIYVHTKECSRCGKCTSCCPASAIESGENSYPVFNLKKCEKCYRCMHHCPNLALSLSKRKRPKKVLRSE